jgi:CelD/BcsL family acetyltransferase involved in cellulose biosynthesis
MSERNKFQIIEVNTPERFLSLRNDWDNLLSRSAANNPFLTFDWQYTWWQHFGMKKSLFILLVKKEDSLIAIAPFMIVTKLGFKVLEFIGQGRSDYLDFIICQDTHKVIKSIFEYLLANSKLWQVVHLSDIAWTQEQIQTISKATPDLLSSYRLYTMSPYIFIASSWDDFLKSKSQRFRKRVRYNFNRIAGQTNSEILKLRKDALTAELPEYLWEIEKKSWKYKTGTAHLENESVRNFFRDIFLKFAAKDWIEIWMAKHNGIPVAFDVNYLYNNRVYSHEGSYDLSYDGYGSILTQFALRDAVEKQYLEYDFLRGDEDYKKLWASAYRDLYQIVFYGKSLYSKLAYLLLFKLRWQLASSKRLRRLPSRIKGVVRKSRRLLSSNDASERR